MRSLRLGFAMILLMALAVSVLACGRKGDPYPRKDLHRSGPQKPATEGEKRG